MTREEHTTPRWAIGAILLVTAIFGILGPKLMYVLSGNRYSDWMRSLPVDVMYLVHPVFRMVLTFGVWVGICALTSRAQRPKLGLVVGWRRALLGIAIGLGATLPMLALGLWSGWPNFAPYLVHTTLVPGITEEIFYRALLFGVLVQAVRMNPWVSAILTGIIFGLAHVDITPDEGETILGQLNMWLALIGIGGFMYAWIYWKAPWNLWVVISLHFAMNLWWDVFEMNQTPLGGLGATLARILSVGIVVYLVIFRRALDPDRSSTIDHDQPRDLERA